MSRIRTFAVAGLGVAAMTFTTLVPAQAAPLPAAGKGLVGGVNGTVDQVHWRRGYYGGYGYRRGNVGGALFAGAALGLIGGALAASAARRDYYYGGYGYPAYGYGYYGRPVGYGYYGRPVGYGYYGGYPGYYGWGY